MLFKFDAQMGLYSYSVRDLVAGEPNRVRHMFTAFKFAREQIGVFADVDGDGVTELIACVDDGQRVVAVDRRNRTIWSSRRDGWTCVPYVDLN